MTPTIGQTVHYVDHINHGGGYARCFDAKVSAVYDDGTVDLDEFLPGASTPAYSVVESGKPGDLYTWHCCHQLDDHIHTPDGGTSPVRGDQRTNALLHHITGGDFL